MRRRTLVRDAAGEAAVSGGGVSGLEATPAGRLDAFLASRGLSREQLMPLLDEPFGQPLLVAAAGSILQGVGNDRSDLDLIVVVEDKVSRMPLASYASSVLVDPAYFSVAEAGQWLPALRDAEWPPAAPVDLGRWGRHLEQLIYATRLAFGLPLAAREGWAGWMDSFREPWLVQRVCQWWRVESVRKQLAARWLFARRPMLAAQRQLEAVLAVLECRVAARGLHFVGPKWLAEKLGALGDREGLAVFRDTMCCPVRESEVAAYIDRCESTRLALGGDDGAGWVASLAYLPGVDAEQRDGLTIVRRGGCRSVALEQRPAALPGDGFPIWSGRVDERLPPSALALLDADLTWLSLGARGS